MSTSLEMIRVRPHTAPLTQLSPLSCYASYKHVDAKLVHSPQDPPKILGARAHVHENPRTTLCRARRLLPRNLLVCIDLDKTRKEESCLAR